jgi:hypothetical protein
MTPKRHKRIEFASQERLSAVEHLAPRFFEEVLDYDYGNCLITDESDMLDFVRPGPPLESALDRIEEHYFFDARSLGTTRIVALLEALHERGVTA